MRYLYSALLVFTSLLWGGNFVVGKFLVHHASTMTLTSLRWIIAVLCLVPVVWMREKRLLPPKRAVLPLILMGATGVVLFNIFMFLAVERTTATNVGLLSALNPVSIAIFSFLLMREGMRAWQGIGMLISFSGVLLVLSGGDFERLFGLRFNAGDLWMIAAVAMWGLYSVFAKKAMRDVSPMMSTLWSGLFGVLLLLPFNISDFVITDPNGEFWWSILYIGVLSTVVAMVLWNVGVQKIGGTQAGMYLNFNPVFTALLAFLLLGEQISWLQAGGTLIVIAGVVLFSRTARPLLKASSSA